jgi:hypothetical protein
MTETNRHTKWLTLFTRGSRRVANYIQALLREARHDRAAPWYLQDPPRLGRRDSILICGAFRRTCAMLRVTYLVIKGWLREPYVPETPTNGYYILSRTIGGAFRPVAWIASVVVAGFVGADFANVHSYLGIENRITLWIEVSAWSLFFGLSIQWWRLLRRLQRVLNQWLASYIDKSFAQCRESDLNTLGFSLGEEFRRRFYVKSVNVLAAATILLFSICIYHVTTR